MEMTVGTCVTLWYISLVYLPGSLREIKINFFNQACFMEHYKKYITNDPAILCGKPIIKGTRISVELIVRNMGEGASIEYLLDAYPHIKKEEILPALRYSASVIDCKEKLVEFRINKSI
jgi:uncharacterized protein (DUF433 family)